MNQILENKKIYLSKKKLYIIQFFIIFIIIFSLIIYFFGKKYSDDKIFKISEITNQSHNITRLYSNEISDNFTANNTSILVIGTIHIPKINITYPIFSQYSENSLKISVCKLYGPNINNTGNLCIIGHNYNNSKFFSKLTLLDINDVIKIYDLNSNFILYYVYSKNEIQPDNLGYLSQNTNREKRNNFDYL